MLDHVETFDNATRRRAGLDRTSIPFSGSLASALGARYGLHLVQDRSTAGGDRALNDHEKVEEPCTGRHAYA
jgi:hypothetical protein